MRWIKAEPRQVEAQGPTLSSKAFQGVICQNWSSRLEVTWRQRSNQIFPYNLVEYKWLWKVLKEVWVGFVKLWCEIGINIYVIFHITAYKISTGIISSGHSALTCSMAHTDTVSSCPSQSQAKLVRKVDIAHYYMTTKTSDYSHKKDTTSVTSQPSNSTPVNPLFYGCSSWMTF